MTGDQSNLPARVGEVLGIAERAVRFLQTLEEGTARPQQHGPQPNAAITQWKALEDELRAQLVRETYDNELLSLQISDASKAERELRKLVSPVARKAKSPADVPPEARTALLKARRLREDIDVWQTALLESDEIVRTCREVEAFMRESRADLERFTESLQRRLRMAETRGTLAHIADQFRILDTSVREEGAAHVRAVEAERAARFKEAMRNEDMQMLKLRGQNADAEVEEEWRRLQQGPQ